MRRTLHQSKARLGTGSVGSQIAAGSITLHIAAYLRQLLQEYEQSDFLKYLIAPSPSSLAEQFHCDEEDVYSALQELKRQGYDYETSGNAGALVLWDPLTRQKSRLPNSTHWSISGFDPA